MDVRTCCGQQIGKSHATLQPAQTPLLEVCVRSAGDCGSRAIPVEKNNNDRIGTTETVHCYETVLDG